MKIRNIYKVKEKYILKKILLLLLVPLLLILFYFLLNQTKTFEINILCLEYKTSNLLEQKTTNVKLNGRIQYSWFKKEKILIESFEIEGYSPPEWVHVSNGAILNEDNNIFKGDLRYIGKISTNDGIFTKIYNIGLIMMSEDMNDICILTYTYDDINNSALWTTAEANIIVGSISDINEISEYEEIRNKFFDLL